MNKDQVLKSLQEIFQDVFDDNELVVDSYTNANQIEGWDSLQQINLISAVEKEFNIRFTLTDLDGLNNVNDFIVLINEKLG